MRRSAARTSSSVVVGEVTTLQHELGDHTVEDAALVAKALLSRAQGAEVLGGLGDIGGVELKGDALGGSIADGDVEENFLRGEKVSAVGRRERRKGLC